MGSSTTGASAAHVNRPSPRCGLIHTGSTVVSQRLTSSHECWPRALSSPPPPLTFHSFSSPFKSLLSPPASGFISCHRLSSGRAAGFSLVLTSYFPAPRVFPSQDVLAGSVRPAGWCQPPLHQSGESLALGALHLSCHGAGGCRRERVGGRTVRLHLQHAAGNEQLSP